MKMQTSLPIAMEDGQEFILRRMMLKGDKNTKLRKGMKKGYRTLGLPLAPAKVSGYQVCPHSSAGCRAACIFESGHAIMFKLINRARIARTLAWFRHRDEFKRMVITNIANEVKTAARRGKLLSVRMNVFSDIPWEKQFPELFDMFPTVQFYDYTKNASRMMRFIQWNFPSNYYLTFSRSENNEDKCLDILRAGGNVAVVFDQGRRTVNRAAVPESWNGFKVIDGDETDLRFLDERGVVVGLYAKFTKGNAEGVKKGFLVSIS